MVLASQAKLISNSLLLLSVLRLAWTLYGAIQRVVFHSSLGSAPAPTGQAAANPRSGATSYNVKQIVSAHLFGRAQDENHASRVTRAPETKLRLALLGVVASDKRELARAVIGVNAADGKNYAVGDKIAGTDAKLHAVEKNRVILDRNGQLESLQMVREGLDDSKQPKLARAPVTISSSTRAEPKTSTSSGEPQPRKRKFPF